jgi:hypothetical protein
LQYTYNHSILPLASSLEDLRGLTFLITGSTVLVTRQNLEQVDCPAEITYEI